MSHLAVFLFPDYGHVKPTLEVTRELVARGHRVTYVLDERYAALATGAGARAVTYRSGRARLAADRSVDATAMGTVGVDFLVETIDTVIPAARAAFAQDLPDAVLYDFESFAVRVLAHDWQRPTVQLFPYLASNDSFSPRWEMFDSEHPSVRSGRATLERFFAANGLRMADAAAFVAEYDDRNLVFLPREFQPRGDTFDERYAFVGPSLLPEERQDPGDAPWRPPADGTAVLLASLGTESNGRPEFFRTFTEAFGDGSWHTVMTLGRGSDPARFAAGLPGVEAHEWLPHPAVLPHARAFVCHGGMGSLMEALYYGTPVLIVPHTPEHRLSGRRVTELGVGRALDPEDMDARSLREAVDTLVRDDDVRKRTEEMRYHARAAGGPSRAADTLEGWLTDR